MSVVVLMTLTTASFLLGCIQQSADRGKIGVIVTIPPQKEMAEAIGGDKITVTVMVPPGQSPHTYAPIPSQMAQVAKAKLYLEVGSGFEFELNHMDELQAQNPKMVVADCSKGITLREMTEEGGGAKDPHIWLSPSNAKQMVRNMCDALIRVDPKNRAFYERNRDEYLSRLSQLDYELKGMLSGKRGSYFLVYHPSWGYLADEYGLRQLAIEEGGKEPGPAGIAAIIEQARESNIKVVFVSPEFDESSAKTIANEIGGEVVTADPLAENYIENLREVGAKLAEGLAVQG